jgi:catalase
MGRIVGVVATEGADLAGVAKLRKDLAKEGALLRVIGPHGGTIGDEIVERTFLTVRSIEFDAIVVPDGAGDVADPRVVVLLQEAFRHSKAIAAWGDGATLLTSAGISADAPGVLVEESASAAQRKALIGAMGLHRAWDRFPATV